MAPSRTFIAGVLAGAVLGAVGLGVVLFTKPTSEVAAQGPGGRGGPGAAGSGRGGPAAFSRGGAAPAVTIAIVEAANVGRTLEAIGSARSSKAATLVAETAGLVTAVEIEAGKAVKQGDALLRLDDEAERIALARARAQYPAAKANADRFAALQEEDAASKLEADTAFNEFKAAEADRRAAEFALSQRTIRAPFDGVVGLTLIQRGDYLRVGDVVTTIDDPASLVIEFTAPQEAASAVKLGQKVTATLAGGAEGTIEGAVSAIDTRVDPVSRTLRIEASFAGGAEIFPGATYAVTTTNDGAAALSVPGLAVQWDRTGAYVWKLAPDGAASRAGVSIIQRTDDIAVISGDVSRGDRVIVEGADRVRPGMSFPGVGAERQGRAGAAPAAAAAN
ncbi:MAG: efflux RND transporter periplasmic adaptor subunit [Parvularculaceae bacterium]|nr:efflux RND transporter periplasmic adaptor subunit [Parvularculaceae bacterium]